MCRIFSLFTVFLLTIIVDQPVRGQAMPKKSSDYKSWSLEQLLFTIDSGLLDDVQRTDYIEHYLQKAKRSASHKDIVEGYKKKIANLEDYSLKERYADSLLIYAIKSNDNKVIAMGYDYKGYVAFTNKKYELALKHSMKAEEFAEKVNDQNTLHDIYATIGNSYYHLENYEQAYFYFRKNTFYHRSKSKDDYNNKLSYIVNLYSLSKTAFRLKKFDTLEVLLKDAKLDVYKLKEHHQPLEFAYVKLVEGMYQSQKGNRKLSDSLLSDALPTIKENHDFANEHLAYLHLGINKWLDGDKTHSLNYFLKIDSLYQSKQFINNELSEAYTYIIKFYSEKKDPEKQLYYTNTLLSISHDLQKSNSHLSKYMYANLDTKNLKDSKQKLEQQLRNNQYWMYLGGTLLVVLVFGFLCYYLWNNKSQRKLRLQVNSHNTTKVNDLNSDNLQYAKPIAIENAKNFDRTTHILNKLKTFEDKKEFLNKITLDELADQFGTNRTTLSKIINENKGSFASYLNNLRISHAIEVLSDEQSTHHLLTVEALAEEFGFGNPKSFSVAFKEIAGVSVSDFIKFRRYTE
ncbi:helix-turn-helix domain-containing protein [Flavobacterium sp. NST-5]|uniref:Helix-turn-helix domain-containing protein n=1 Tax=Flavobacterium ichthyis TaxID=2698827 RepID=A0ABW9ZAC9_9FLAO|nr:AraC family transcriptional regulator [Flavobacterium ichthyis]NBL65075.1 helix-turn-helix domain-containing protein [Flavobacterium ichthyis]